MVYAVNELVWFPLAQVRLLFFSQLSGPGMMSSAVLQHFLPVFGTWPPLTTDLCVLGLSCPHLQQGAEATCPRLGAAVRVHGAFEPRSLSPIKAGAESAGCFRLQEMEMPAQRSLNDKGIHHLMYKDG